MPPGELVYAYRYAIGCKRPRVLKITASGAEGGAKTSQPHTQRKIYHGLFGTYPIVGIWQLGQYLQHCVVPLWACVCIKKMEFWTRLCQISSNKSKIRSEGTAYAKSFM